MSQINASAHPGRVQTLALKDRAAIKAEVEAAMQAVSPLQGRNPPQSIVLPSEQMVLWGNLFGDNRLWAITETNNPEFGVACLEWKDGRWQMHDVWHARADWVPEGTKAEDRGYYHVSPPSVPFTLKDLSGDGVPEVLIYFNNDGYRDGYEIIKLDGQKRNLSLVAISEDGEPEYSGGYLITYQSSGRKAWWGQNIYHKWIDGAPVEVATWTDGNEKESDQGPTLFTVDTSAAHPVGSQHFIIPRECGDDGEMPASVYTILKEGKPIAKVTFQWLEKYLSSQSPTDPFAAESLYLFEKLTGLPWRAYGSKINSGKPSDAKNAQSHFTVNVTGTPEGIKLLSPTGK